jgi:hypothetical protein
MLSRPSAEDTHRCCSPPLSLSTRHMLTFLERTIHSWLTLNSIQMQDLTSEARVSWDKNEEAPVRCVCVRVCLRVYV